MPVVLLSIFCGCARYEFDVLEPPELRTHVGRKKQAAADMRREPLDYHMRAYEGRLVMNIYNNEAEPIELLGDQSFAVDPEGESHPLADAVIAPSSYIKLILPPLRPYYPADPRFGFGIGIGISRYDYYPYYPYYPYRHPYRGPRFRHYLAPELEETSRTYFYATDPASYFWSWRKEGTVRLRLTYRRQNDEMFHHEFVIRKVKV